MSGPTNEEEVKVQIVLTWLRAQGVGVDELSLESSFKVRFGTNDVLVGAGAHKQFKRGRLDLLVHRRGINLLVIEVKEPEVTLSDADRDQAVSYARLVHPVAPFALVTNGSEFRLYDVLSKQLVSPERLRLADGTAIVLPDETRLEALRLFFDWSPDNLVAFCRAQVARETRHLYGGPNDLSAVYIPELHVRRQGLIDAALAPPSADAPLFVLVGESGMGKSSAMVDIADALASEGYPVLFFVGARMGGDVLDEVASEVDWAYGNQRGSIDTLKCLAKNTGGKPLVVMIDGVEDLPLPTKAQHLATLARRVGPIGVRLVLSAKTGSWEQFTISRGHRTQIHTAIHRATVERPFSVEVGPLEPREFFRAVESHKQVFGLNALFDPTALREAQANPFVLRLLFQVKAAGTEGRTSDGNESAAVRLAFDTRDLFDQYLELAAQKAGGGDVVVGMLVGVARALYDVDQDWIDEPTLRDFLRMPPTEPMPSPLFEQRLLIGSGIPGVRRVGFAFGLLRSFLSAFHVRRWPTAPHGELAAAASSAMPGGPRSEALMFYYPFAAEDQRRELDGPVRANAELYLDHYIALIEEFPALRSSFRPFTPGPVGLAANLRFPGRVSMFGFRALKPNDDTVQFFPMDSADEHVTRLYAAGVDRPHFHSRVSGFLRPMSRDDVCDIELAEQVEHLVAEGRLNESAVPELAEELLACIVGSYACFSHLRDSGTKRARYPLRVRDVEKALRHEHLNRHFHDREVADKRARGEIQERWMGSTVSYNATLSQAEWLRVRERALAALLADEQVDFKTTYVDLERLKSRLARVSESLGGPEGTLSGPVLPERDAIAASIRSGGEPPPECVKQHCGRVLELALKGYRELVRVNFPNHAAGFGFYARGPLRAVLALDPGFVRGEGHSFLAFCRSRHSECEVTVCDVADAVLDMDKAVVTTAEGAHAYLSVRWPEIGDFLYGRRGTVQGLDCDAAVVRGWVYGWIQDHFRGGRTTDWLRSRTVPHRYQAP